MKLFSISLIGCLFFSAIVYAKSPKATFAGAVIAKQQIPFCFIENNGQLHDQYGNNRQDVDVKLSGNNMTVFVGQGQLHYQFNAPVKNKKQHLHQQLAYRIDVTLIGANKNAKLIKESPLDYYENYCGTDKNNPCVTAHAFEKIVYKNIYPGIDWVLYIKDDKLEYDFVLEPGAHTKDIQLQYSGSTKLKLLDKETMKLVSPMGTLTEGKLAAYEKETKKPIAAAFKKNKNTLNFEVQPYAGTLVLDPVINWSTYFGKGGGDVITAVVNDITGNVYATGHTDWLATNIATSGSFMSTASAYNMFLVKFAADGSRLWGTYYGGNKYDYAASIAYDATSDNIYVGGYTYSDSAFATAGSYQDTFRGGSYDAFLVKFNSIGWPKWATYYGGSGDDVCNGVACDAHGNVYMTGYSTSNTRIASALAYQTTKSGQEDAFLAKFNGAGARQWATYYGGTRFDEGRAVTCDNQGYVYFTGFSNSTYSIASAGAHQITLGDTTWGDGFLVKFDDTGARVWGTFYGGSAIDQANAVACDSANNIYIAGYTQSDTGIGTTGTYQSNKSSTSSGNREAFVAKFNSSGVRQWGSYFGGSSTETAYALTCDQNNNAFMACNTYGSTGLSTADATDCCYTGTVGSNCDAMLVKFSPSGQRIWATYLGGNNDDFPTGLCNDGTGNVYLGGYTKSTTSVATSSSFQPAFGTGTSVTGFLTNYVFDSVVNIRKPFVDTGMCIDVPYKLYYTVTGNYLSGNIFKAQLSDSNGSFASPVQIGADTSVSSGYISCYIPATTLPGKHYRMRIVATNPSYTTPDDGKDIIFSNIPSKPSISSNSPVCEFDSLGIIANDTTTAINSYKWSWWGRFTDTTGTDTLSFKQVSPSGTWMFSVKVGVNGCYSDSGGSYLVINAAPTKPTASSNSPLCEYDTLLLHTTTSSSVTYSWAGPAGYIGSSASARRDSVSLVDTGLYIVTATSSANCVSKDTTKVAIKPQVTPSVSINVSPGTTVSNGTLVTFTAVVINPGTAPAYQWLKNGTDIIAATSSVYNTTTLVDHDAIGIKIHSNAQCRSTDTAFAGPVNMNILPVTVSETTTENNNIHLYPNPNKGNFILSGDIYHNKKEPLKILVADENGKIVYADTHTSTGILYKTIDLRNQLAPGIYYLLVCNSNATYKLKFTVTK